jgi:hypothetical protein
MRCWSSGYGTGDTGGSLPVLRNFQVTLDFNSFFNAGRCGPSSILPKDFDMTSNRNGACCPGGGPIGSSNPNGFIDTTHPAFVFLGIPHVITSDTARCNYRFAGTVSGNNTPASICPISPPKYSGTVLMEVSPGATGRFELCLSALDRFNPTKGNRLPGCGPDDSFFTHWTPDATPDPPPPRILPINFECATVEIAPPGECEDGCPPFCPCVFAIDSSSPANGFVDARQPNNIDGSNPSGIREIEITFDEEVSDNHVNAGCVAPDRFEIMVTGGTAPGIGPITRIDGDTFRVQLTDRIPPGNWTKLTYMGDDRADSSVCLGYLPADVIGDRTSNSFDLLRLIDCLNRVATCQIHQCDVNRTGECNSQDILREVDLLNPIPALGGPWNGRTLGPSPCQ